MEVGSVFESVLVVCVAVLGSGSSTDLLFF